MVDEDILAGFESMHASSKLRRARNRDYAMRALSAADVRFTSHNDGAHLIVEGRFDFWPGTGLWKVRGEQPHHRGIHKLLDRIRSDRGRP